MSPFSSPFLCYLVNGVAVRISPTPPTGWPCTELKSAEETFPRTETAMVGYDPMLLLFFTFY
jgi:hypothetical protein